MTLQEIQYKAQSIIHKWRDDDSAPYIEFVDELAHMIVPEPSADLEEAADNHIRKVADTAGHPGWDWTTQDIAEAFIAGAKWQAEQLLKSSPLPEDTVLFQKGVAEGKRLMMEDYPKWHKVQRGSCFDKYTNFLLLAREGHFYCSSMEVPRDGYILLVDELERLPKEDEK